MQLREELHLFREPDGSLHPLRYINAKVRRELPALSYGMNGRSAPGTSGSTANPPPDPAGLGFQQVGSYLGAAAVAPTSSAEPLMAQSRQSGASLPRKVSEGNRTSRGGKEDDANDPELTFAAVCYFRRNRHDRAIIPDWRCSTRGAHPPRVNPTRCLRPSAEARRRRQSSAGRKDG